jgi:hypothetical protein
VEYLNEYHRQHSERLKEHLAKQPKASLEDAMRQYDRIKHGRIPVLRFVSENMALSGFSGHIPLSLVPDFPIALAESLQSLSITTAEAFLSWQVTQPPGVAVTALGIDLDTFATALRVARAVVSKGFLRELEGPQQGSRNEVDV